MPTLSLPHRTCITSRTSVVQLEYSSETGPLPTPEAVGGAQWTRFVLLSDTHARTCSVPDGDVLLHAGDLTEHGTLKELETTIDWLSGLPHRIKIIIAGNHDSAIHREWYEANWKEIFRHRSKDGPESAAAVLELLKGPRAIAANIVYLENEEYKFQVRDGGKEWSVYGSPWSPNFGVWAFGCEREDGESLVSSFPETDILMTHGPPRNILDFTNMKDRAGCDDLAARVQELKPKLHVFGHIHEAHGAYIPAYQGTATAEAEANGEDEEIEDYSDDSDDERVDYGPVLDFETGQGPHPVADDGNTETIFVNAANLPSGPNARRTGTRGKMGGEAFQPIIVDL
ncbi:Metallo-dependent phosphatase-like protein, partial [Mycena galericulata]